MTAETQILSLLKSKGPHTSMVVIDVLRKNGFHSSRDNFKRAFVALMKQRRISRKEVPCECCGVRSFRYEFKSENKFDT